jgi:prepilin-type processing-associated H-X9-DG protein
VFAQAREKARQTACLSNMKQLMLADLQYAQDNDETHSYVFGDPDTQSTSWSQAVFPYVKNLGVYVCPSDSITRSDPNRPACSYSQPWVQTKSGSRRPADNPICATGRTESEVAAPATTILLTERYGNQHYQNFFGSQDNWCSGYSTSNYPGGTLFAYQGGSNYGFADGHAKYMMFNQTLERQGNQRTAAEIGKTPCRKKPSNEVAPYFGMWDAVQ